MNHVPSVNHYHIIFILVSWDATIGLLPGFVLDDSIITHTGSIFLSFGTS
jgi:hypothetical protein